MYLDFEAGFTFLAIECSVARSLVFPRNAIVLALAVGSPFLSNKWTGFVTQTWQPWLNERTGDQATGILGESGIAHPEMKTTYFLIIYVSIMVGLSFSKLARPTIPAIAHHFGTRGRYEEVNSHLLDDISFVNKSVVVPPSPDCRAIYMVSVIRHGTRYPTTKNVKKIARLFDLVVSHASGSASWLNYIKTWKMWYTEDMDGRLVEKGREDIWLWDWHSPSPLWFLRIISVPTASSSSPAPSIAVLIVSKLFKRVFTDSGRFRVGLVSLTY